MQQKTTLLAVFLIVNVLLLAGCSANPNEPPSSLPKKRFAGVTLRIACPDVLTQRVIAQSAKGWANRSGVNLELVSYDPENARPDAGADVWVLEAMTLPRWVAANELQPLPEEMTAKDGSLQWSGLLDQYGKRLLTWDQRAYAVPLLGDAPVCFYRKDLLADPKHVTRFKARYGRDIAVPATWEEFAVLAEFFQETRIDDGKHPSLPPLPERGHDLDRLFYTVAASFARRGVDRGGMEPSREDLFSFHFDHETGKPRIANAGFVKGLEMMQRLQACRPEGREREPGQAFRAEQAVLCLGDIRLLGRFRENDSPVRHHVGVCLVPGHRLDGATENRIPYLGEGAFVLAVPRSSKQSEAGFALLEELGSKNGSQQIILEPAWGGGATRLAQLDEDWTSFRLEPSQAVQLRQTIRRTLQPPVRNPVLVLRVPREREFRARLTERLRPALEAITAASEEGARKVLQGVSSDWESLIGAETAEHLRAYRMSLGLQ